jgi:hypothetical protein
MSGRNSGGIERPMCRKFWGSRPGRSDCCFTFVTVRRGTGESISFQHPRNRWRSRIYLLIFRVFPIGIPYAFCPCCFLIRNLPTLNIFNSHWKSCVFARNLNIGPQLTFKRVAVRPKYAWVPGSNSVGIPLECFSWLGRLFHQGLRIRLVLCWAWFRMCLRIN